jgi:hypothetical protein
VIPAFSVALDLFDDLAHFPLTLFVRVPAWQYLLVVVIAVIAPTTRVECDIRVASVHDAVGTNLILYVVHISS